MKRSLVIILGLILVGFGLRVWNLSGPSIWWDEAFTVQTTSHGWDNFWQQLQLGDRNPPLYFLSVRLWGSVAGWSEFSLRFLSLMYGVIGLVFLAKLVQRLFGPTASEWALAAAASSPALVVYSQEGRMYAMFFALAAGTAYGLARITDRGGHNTFFSLRTKPALMLLAFESALLLTHYFAVPLVAALNLLILIDWFRRRVMRRVYLDWLSGQLLAGFPLIIWVILVAATPGSLALANEPRPDLVEFSRQVLVLWATGVRDLTNRWLWIAVGTLGLVLLASIGAWLYDRQRASVVIAVGAVAVGLAFALTSALTSFHPRYMLPYSLLLFALTGGAANLTADRRPRTAGEGPWWVIGRRITGVFSSVAIVGLTIAGWNVATLPDYAKDDARGVATYLKTHAATADVILVEANDYTLEYYDHGPASTKMIFAATEPEAWQQLSTAIANARRVWLAHWRVSTQDPRGYWRFLLEQSGRLIDWTSYRGYELYLYEMQSSLRAPVLHDNPPLTFDSISAKRWSNVSALTDGALAVAIEWRRGYQSPPWTRASVGLVDESGQRIYAVDAALADDRGRPPPDWPADQSVLNYYVLPIPSGTPPLTYSVTVRLYGGRDTTGEQTLGVVKLPRRLDRSDPYRTLAGYHWETPPVTTIAPGLELEGFSISSKSPLPLDTVDVTLRWRKTRSAANVVPHLRLIQADRAWVDGGSNLFARQYPIDQWLDGETVIEHRQLIYPPVLGEMQLQVGQGDQWTALTAMALNTATLKLEPPSIQHSQQAVYDDFAELLGYDLAADSIAPNRPLDVTLYWRAHNIGPITASYTAFTQLIAPDGHLIAQHDAPPSDRPTPAWVPGEVIVARHRLTVLDPTYHGSAALIVGWYNSATIERVEVQAGGDFVTLQTPIQVEDK